LGGGGAGSYEVREMRIEFKSPCVFIDIDELLRIGRAQPADHRFMQLCKDESFDSLKRATKKLLLTCWGFVQLGEFECG
jgi:hypothetical protein